METPVDAVAPDTTPGTHDAELVQALTQLDDAYRMPVLLHYYADLSLEQVAATLNLSVPAIKSRLHRARAQLRNFLAEAEEQESQGAER
jgi:RNA polymerase sigma-70 factor (ECF subfamily)